MPERKYRCKVKISRWHNFPCPCLWEEWASTDHSKKFPAELLNQDEYTNPPKESE
jgi:hypothetical protein